MLKFKTYMYIKYYRSEKSHKNVFNIYNLFKKIPKSHETLPNRNMHIEKTRFLTRINLKGQKIRKEYCSLIKEILVKTQGSTTSHPSN